MSDQAELERLAELLPRLVMAVVFQCMRSPHGIAVDKPHLRHAWLIAKSVERIADANGYWTPESTSALIDMRTAMLEALRVLHDQERGVPPEPDHVDMHGGEWMLQRDPDEGDADYAARMLLFEGSDRELKRQLSRSIVYLTEAAGEWDQAAFLRSIDFPQDWMIYAFDTPARVPLDEFVRVYDAAAKRARWQPLHEIVKEVTQRQRFKEWP